MIALAAALFSTRGFGGSQVATNQGIPSEELQAVKNFQVLSALAREGDQPETTRKVTHWLYFNGDAARQTCWERLRTKGFVLDSQHMGEARDERFALQIHHLGPATAGSINPITIDLMHLAYEVGGDHDGWETSVEKRK